MAPAPLLTTEDYFRTPESLLPTEVIYGALRVAESPQLRHQQAVGAFYFALETHVRRLRSGMVLVSPMDVVFDYARALILQPDLIFISPDRQPDVIRNQKVIGAPDLVLEVLSPNPRIGKLQERLDWFAEHGVREIWLLHQDAGQFELLGAANGRVTSRERYSYDMAIRSQVLPSFSPTIDEILRG
jgi:Uma2 family endonuclease